MVAWPYAALTVAALALWLTEVDHPATQMLALTTFWWSLPGVLLVAIALLRRDVVAVVLLAVPAGLWLWAYGGAFVPSAGTDVAADVRVASLNTFVGAPDASHVLDLIDAEAPDVLLLQEVFAPREEALRSDLADRYPHVHADRSEGVGAVMVMSRHPIIDVVEVEEASDRSRLTSVVTLDVDGVALQVSSLHLISPCPTCGPSILERLELEDDVRRAEVGAVLDALDPELPAIVGGDLNSGDRSTAYRQLVAAGFRDPQREVGSGMGFTWPADARPLRPMVRIDWVLTRALAPVTAGVADTDGSDHRAVVVDVAFER